MNVKLQINDLSLVINYPLNGGTNSEFVAPVLKSTLFRFNIIPSEIKVNKSLMLTKTEYISTLKSLKHYSNHSLNKGYSKSRFNTISKVK